MAKLGETAKSYQAKQVHNIADLEVVSVDFEVREATDVNFPYSYVEVQGQRYKVPASVLSSLKDLLEVNANLKTFRVKKNGEGMKTSYTVIPLQ